MATVAHQTQVELLPTVPMLVGVSAARVTGEQTMAAVQMAPVQRLSFARGHSRGTCLPCPRCYAHTHHMGPTPLHMILDPPHP
ncbi:MAG: hypothetical protein NT062_25075, partial [Proteobacteria bacterium]|nr:hypothetical protein [Pseudomonadota bacterium]